MAPAYVLRVTMTADHFVERLAAEVPEARPALAEHLEQNGQLLLHLLMADLVRLCDSAWSAADEDVLRRCLRLLDQALGDGDEYVQNAVAVSFVEDSSWYQPEKQAYIATWPVRLRAEAEAQRAHWATDGPAGP